MLPESVRAAIHWAADFIFGPWTLALLLGSGIFLTLRLRFVQVRRFGDALRAVRTTGSTGAAGALSPFQAFMTALAGSIGTGNIVGVATAVASGGPGAVFWIWCYGFVATAIKFTEAVLGVRFRVISGERLSAGPMHYLRDGLKMPWLGWLYALVAGVAALTTTPFTQPNSMADVLRSQLRIPTWISGLAIAVLAWLVIIGGVKSIGRAAEKLSPLKVSLYLLGGLVVIGTGETFKNAVNMTFAKGASLPDPSGLFNASLEGNTRRAIDFHEGDKIDEKALKALIRAAVSAEQVHGLTLIHGIKNISPRKCG